MGYYWITQAQRYIQSLGFGSTLPNVNKRQQLLRIDQFGGDNSFYRDGTGKLTITLGKGGVDDAEDAEVIVHEYGHSVQDDQVPGFGSTPEAGAIGEAFGDYLAVTVSQHFAPTPDEPCVADWDSTSYTRTTPHCLRRIDGTKLYPADLRRGPRRRRDLVARAVRHPPGARAPTRPTRSSSGRSSASRPTISMPAARGDDDRHRPRPVRRRAWPARAQRLRTPAGSRSGAHAPLQRQGRPRAGAKTAGPWPSRYRPAPSGPSLPADGG